MNQIGETILMQLTRRDDGNTAFRALSAFLGAKDLLFGNTEVCFRWKARARNGANALKIQLDPNDTYMVEFRFERAGKVTVRSAHSNIYAEELKSLFERETGLFLSFR